MAVVVLVNTAGGGRGGEYCQSRWDCGGGGIQSWSSFLSTTVVVVAIVSSSFWSTLVAVVAVINCSGGWIMVPGGCHHCQLWLDCGGRGITSWEWLVSGSLWCFHFVVLVVFINAGGGGGHGCRRLWCW